MNTSHYSQTSRTSSETEPDCLKGQLHLSQAGRSFVNTISNAL